jgi:hypothetical protein
MSCTPMEQAFSALAGEVAKATAVEEQRWLAEVADEWPTGRFERVSPNDTQRPRDVE